MCKVWWIWNSFHRWPVLWQHIHLTNAISHWASCSHHFTGDKSADKIVCLRTPDKEVRQVLLSRPLQQMVWLCRPRTTDTQWRHKSKKSEKSGRWGRQNMLPPYLKIWDWDWVFCRAVKAISSLGVRSPWARPRRSRKFHIIMFAFKKPSMQPVIMWIS